MAEITMADLMEIITTQEGRVTIREDRALAHLAGLTAPQEDSNKEGRALHGSHPARKDKTKTDLIILMAGKAARKTRTIPISNSLRTVFQI